MDPAGDGEMHRTQPCEAIREILLPTQGLHGYGCAHLHACSSDFGCSPTQLWNPSEGLVPRSFAGAVNVPGDVRLIVVLAEPSDPEKQNGRVYEPFDSRQTVGERFAVAAWYSYSKLEQAVPITRQEIDEGTWNYTQRTQPPERMIELYTAICGDS